VAVVGEISEEPVAFQSRAGLAATIRQKRFGLIPYYAGLPPLEHY
jgi:hypothetical protein